MLHAVLGHDRCAVCVIAVVCCLGDSVAQLLLESKGAAKRYDIVRTIRMTSIGFFFTVSSL